MTVILWVPFSLRQEKGGGEETPQHQYFTQSYTYSTSLVELGLKPEL